MGPYVIDGKKSQQYVAIFVLSLIASFALGYYAGSVNNVPQKQQSYEELKSTILSGKKAKEVTQEESTSKQPETTGKVTPQKSPQAKEEITPKKEVTKKVTEKSKPNVSNTKVAKPKVNKPKTSQPVVNKPKPVQKKVVKTKPPKPKPVATKKASSQVAKENEKPEAKPAPPTKPTEDPEVSTLSQEPPEDIEEDVDLTNDSGIPPPTPSNDQQDQPGSSSQADIKPTESSKGFSVQVGLFANKTNAQNFVDDLIEKGFAAYMDDFVARDGAVKYNVRFGHFADRQSVQARLTEYKQIFSTPAYVVINK